MRKKNNRKKDFFSKPVVFTLETRLNKQENKELIDYFQSIVPFYSKIFRFVWHDIKRNGLSVLLDKQKAKYNTFLQNKFSISKRTANSIISDVSGRYNALFELKLYEITQIEGKIQRNIKIIAKLKEKINKTKPSVANNSATKRKLKFYLKNKKELYWRQQKINRLKNKINTIQKQLQTGNLVVCFGTKKLFKAQYFLEENKLKSHEKWLNKFRKNRDKNIYYVGSSDETSCNSRFQLEKMENNCYQIKVRNMDKKSNKRYFYGQCQFKYQNLEKYLDANLKLSKSNKKCVALSYRIVFRDKKIYLQALFTYNKSIVACEGDTDYTYTTKAFGTIGLDFNDGFIQLAETNETGNLVKLKKILLVHHGTGDKAKSEIREKVAKIVHYCQIRGKSLAIEDLDFKKTKSQTTKANSNKGKEYNKMIHNFDYSRYKSCIKNACARNNVSLIPVNPAYTSKIAKQKYCKPRSLGVHQGASFVIARRGQGFIDYYKKRIKKDEKESIKK